MVNFFCEGLAKFATNVCCKDGEAAQRPACAEALPLLFQFKTTEYGYRRCKTR
jgi:hypothetical protein